MFFDLKAFIFNSWFFYPSDYFILTLHYKFIAQGANDPRVNKAESDQMA